MRYLLISYVPEDSLEQVKQAVCQAGAGRIGNYQNCCWQVLGQGQFMPLEGSQPAIGQQDQLETVKEYRVEWVCETAHLPSILRALKQAHPYETPAYSVLACVDQPQEVS